MVAQIATMINHAIINLPNGNGICPGHSPLTIDAGPKQKAPTPYATIGHLPEFAAEDIHIKLLHAR